MGRIVFNKEREYIPVDNFDDKNPYKPGSFEALEFDKACRSMRKARLLSSDQAYTKDDIDFLNDNIAE